MFLVYEVSQFDLTRLGPCTTSLQLYHTSMFADGSDADYSPAPPRATCATAPHRIQAFVVLFQSAQRKASWGARGMPSDGGRGVGINVQIDHRSPCALAVGRRYHLTRCCVVRRSIVSQLFSRTVTARPSIVPGSAPRVRSRPLVHAPRRCVAAGPARARTARPRSSRPPRSRLPVPVRPCRSTGPVRTRSGTAGSLQPAPART